MRHQIENGSLTLEADTHGAELCSLRKAGGPGELLWSADPAVWGRHAPLCFPWCGRMRDNYFEEGGRRYEAGSHGFARDMEHMLSASGPDFLTFRLGWNGETLALWPWKFSLETTHRLEGDSVVTVCRVQNEDSRLMPFQLGFHTALRCPFTPGKAATDYLVRFEREESPLRVRCDENGLATGEETPVFPGQSAVPLTPGLFDDDSICMKGLRSSWVQLEEAETGRYLRISCEGYPYTLLWSKPGIPGFLCIEPWHGLPGRADLGHAFSERPCLTTLAPGESWSCTHILTAGV